MKLLSRLSNQLKFNTVRVAMPDLRSPTRPSPRLRPWWLVTAVRLLARLSIIRLVSCQLFHNTRLSNQLPSQSNIVLRPRLMCIPPANWARLIDRLLLSVQPRCANRLVARRRPRLRLMRWLKCSPWLISKMPVSVRLIVWLAQWCDRPMLIGSRTRASMSWRLLLLISLLLPPLILYLLKSLSPLLLAPLTLRQLRLSPATILSMTLIYRLTRLVLWRCRSQTSGND